MRLWPHQSLSPRGFAIFVGSTFVMILIPTLSVLGTALLWGLLPFVMLAVAAIWVALRANHRARLIEEVLTLDDTTAALTHRTAKGEVKHWQDNRYWTKVTKYKDEGPVPHYVTLRGSVQLAEQLGQVVLGADAPRATRGQHHG